MRNLWWIGEIWVHKKYCKTMVWGVSYPSQLLELDALSLSVTFFFELADEGEYSKRSLS